MGTQYDGFTPKTIQEGPQEHTKYQKYTKYRKQNLDANFLEKNDTERMGGGLHPGVDDYSLKEKKKISILYPR